MSIGLVYKICHEAPSVMQHPLLLPPNDCKTINVDGMTKYYGPH